MHYLDIDRLRSLGREEFLAVEPYPHYNPHGLLTAQGFEDLLNNMPPLESFGEIFGKQRRAGQAPHDRYSLEYTPETEVPAPWREFIAELCSDNYRREIERLLGARRAEFRFHWHYTPTGCDVSPHCDARREHGSHLFYFNSEADWSPDWGGSTLVLDDGGRLDYNSAPSLDVFDSVKEMDSIGNYSALMLRTDHAWHAVKPIACPEDRLRKVFIVVVNPNSLFWKLRDRVVGKTIQRF
ncbi:MAG: hypothetical protein AAGI24_05170 [Pseudomonadota bacterium]